MFSKIGEFLKPVTPEDGKRAHEVFGSRETSSGGGHGGGGYGGAFAKGAQPGSEGGVVAADDSVTISLSALLAFLDAPAPKAQVSEDSFPALSAGDLGILASQAAEAYRRAGVAVSGFSPAGEETKALEGDIRRRIESLKKSGREGLTVAAGESVLAALMRETGLLPQKEK